MSRFSATWLSGLLVTLIVAGCAGPAGDPNRPKTVPVSGTVTYNGDPVEGATVTFMTDSAEGKGAVGRTDASGHFTLMTFEPGDGAVPGNYKVTVTKTKTEGTLSEEEANKYLERGENPPAPAVTDLLPEKYKSPETSGLTAEVTEGGENNFTFELTD